MNMVGRKASLLIFGVAAACAGEAAAQAGGAGPAGAAGGGVDRFTLDVRGRVSYEENQTARNDSLLNLRDLEPEDVVYSTGISMSYQLPSARQTALVTATADINRHRRNKQLDGENLAVTALLSRRLSACAVSGNVGYTRRQSEIDELTVVAVTKNVATQRLVGVQATCGAGNIVGSVGGQVSKTTNSANDAGYVDSQVESATASLGYANQTLGTLSVFGQYSTSSYDDITLPGAAVARNFRQTGGGLSYSRRIGSRLNGAASVSYTVLDSDLEGGDSEGWTASASLNYRLSTRSNLNLAYSRGDQASSTIFASSQFTEKLDLSGTYRLSSRIDFRASASAAQNRFRTTQIGVQVTEDKVFKYGAGVSYRIGRDIRLGLDADYTERDANMALFDSEAMRVAVSVSSSF